MASTQSIPVALVGGSLRIGGAERQIVRLINGLRGTCYRPLLVLKRAEGPLLDQVDTSRTPILELGFQRLQSPDGVRAIRKLREFLDEHEAVILQTYLYGSHLVGAWALHGMSAASKQRMHHIMCVRSHALPMPAVMKPFYRWAGRRTAKVVAVSDDISKTVQDWGVPAPLIEVISNGVDVIPAASAAGRRRMRDEFGTPPGALLLGMVGNLRPGKGHEDLLAALALRAERRDWHLVLVGDGPLRDDLSTLASNLDIDDRVVFAGRRDDVPEILSALDVFIYPSHSEGMPNALLEAMAAGLPCIASNIPVHAHLLDGGDAGILVPLRSPEAIDRALDDLDGAEARGLLGAKAQKRIRLDFSVENMLARYQALYASLAAEGRAQSI